MVKTVIPVILCGGSGTRLWPASREHYPKQFLPLIDDYSLLQNTALRALRISGGKPEHVVTVTLDTLSSEVKNQLAEIDPAAAEHVLGEPSARNTAAAVAYAAAYIKRVFGGDTVMWILPADHYIGNEEEMRAAFHEGVRASEAGYLVTFGIRPTRPDTGYGYIRLGQLFLDSRIHLAEAFVEKPDADTARSYIAAGNYLWNSGMFVFSTDRLLTEYETHAADILNKVYMAINNTYHLPRASNDHYSTIPEAPFDKAIMEKSSRVAIIPCDPAWSDIGSWESLWEIREKDAQGNVLQGNAFCQNARNCFVQGGRKLVALAGVENLVVIETGDALLIADRRDADSLRSLVKALKSKGYAEMSHPAPVYGFESLEARVGTA